jgi:hypothetical protein
MSRHIDMESLVATGRTALELAVRGGEPFLPMMLVTNLRGQSVAVGLAIDNVGDMLPGLLPSIVQEPLHSLSLTIDSYYCLVRSMDEERPMNMAEAFEAGDPRVCEALSVHMVTADSMDYVMVPYRRIGPQQRVLAWRDPIAQDSLAVGGRITDAMREAIVASQSL